MIYFIYNLFIVDACHTLTCALMLLNTDLHGQVGKGKINRINISMHTEIIHPLKITKYKFMSLKMTEIF